MNSLSTQKFLFDSNKLDKHNAENENCTSFPHKAHICPQKVVVIIKHNAENALASIKHIQFNPQKLKNALAYHTKV
jgi:hypothetical protein